MIKSNHHPRPAAFSLIELLVVIGIIAILLAILLPAIEHSRERANEVQCAARLHDIGIALQAYGNENSNYYPRTVYDPAAPLCYGTNPVAADPFAAGGPNPNDITAALFLLIRTEHISPKTFNEPYTDEVQAVPDPAPDPSIRSNFTDYKNNLSYSYANPYPNAVATAAGYSLTTHMNPTFAVAADTNPGVGPGKNSRNHEGRGQNVLYADGHAEWQKTTTCGTNNDEIYSNKAGIIQASPIDTDDSVLLPID